eukprot:TRINITY_DN90917_c0_g1_i1.p1 TRINITY_DN90917_c0_g1~~TRINITY_DN90917_c0_g1_i1.p1  ORF type:complete len:211 (+),score=39.03 TRINITY_DN90917_c0_g1_i1:57-635(+)
MDARPSGQKGVRRTSMLALLVLVTASVATIECSFWEQLFGGGRAWLGPVCWFRLHACGTKAGKTSTVRHCDGHEVDGAATDINSQEDAQTDAPGPRMYSRAMRETELGNAFWRRTFDGEWGQKASGDAGAFDLDDAVEARYPGTDDWYCGSVKKYIGHSDWIVLWVDDVPDDDVQASVIKTKDMRQIFYSQQ